MVVRWKSCRKGVKAEKATGPAGIVQLMLLGSGTVEDGARRLSQKADSVSSRGNEMMDVLWKRVALQIAYVRCVSQLDRPFEQDATKRAYRGVLGSRLGSHHQSGRTHRTSTRCSRRNWQFGHRRR